MKAKLVVTREGAGDALRIEHDLSAGAAAIGRSRENDLVLPDEEKRVSGRHARIERKESSWYVVDLNSKNGTYLGDQRLEPHQPARVDHGDVLFIEDFRLEVVVERVDLESTLERADPVRRAGQLAEEVADLYARHAQDPPEERRQRIRQAIQGAIAGLTPETARAVCLEVRSRFGSGPSEPRREGSPAGGADLARQEELYRAGYDVVGALSRRLLGEREFTSAGEVRTFGTLLEQAVLTTLDWLSRNLKGRREFEKQFSAELTLIFSREHNPIKSRETSPEAIGKWLLDWQDDPDVGARREALEGAFKDLTLHQLALLSGAQDSIRAVLERLDPRALEARVRSEATGALSRLLLKLQPQRRVWKQYVLSHAEMFEENSKLFNEVVYPSIRKGYLAAHASPERSEEPESGGRS